MEQAKHRKVRIHRQKIQETLFNIGTTSIKIQLVHGTKDVRLRNYITKRFDPIASTKIVLTT